jgi:16S rRNA (uracil1498-N3)-methyltransferase
VERDDRAAVVVGTFFADDAFAAGTAATLGEDAAHHARVKRLQVGDVVRLTSGAGQIATGSIAAIDRASIAVAVENVAAVPRRSEIHLCVPIADRDRMLWLAEKATELGVTSWRAVRFRRSMSVSPRGEGPQFAKKIRARMISALEQSGGAWLPEAFPDAGVESLAANAMGRRILLDVGGAPLLSTLEGQESLAVSIVLGPEGGFEKDEMALLVESGWVPAALGDTTLRFETAGIAVVAIVRAMLAGLSHGKNARQRE